MKFVGIIFCVLLFCSKIVDSNPQSEGQIRQRAYQSSNWPVNKNVANEEYPDTDFAQSQNGDTLINQEPNENVRNYYPNQARYTNDFRYNKGPILSQRAEVLANDDSSEDGRILESYPSRVERYPLRTSQVRLDDQNKRNWQQPNQYLRSQVVISENERPLETVEEPYRPVQFVKPKYIPPVNQRFRQPDRSFVAREQYPITRNADDTEYVANPAPRYQSRGPVTYESFSEDQDTPVETRVRVNNQKYVQNPSIVSQSRITHNGARENVGYVENDRFLNTAPISNYNDSPSGITVVENYDTDAVDLTPVNEEREIPVEVNKVPLQRPQIQRYPNNFRPTSHWSNVARHQTYNAVPVPTNYEGDLVSNNPAPINDNGAPSVPIIQRPVSSEDEDEPRTPYSDNTNPDRNLYRQLTSGVQSFPPQADESYSAPPPPPPSFEASPENDKIKIVPVFEPANDDNSKPKNTNEPEDEETSRPLPPNETQPLNDNTKPQSEEPVQPVNQNRFVRPYRPLPPYARRPILRPPFKPLPPYARNKFQPLFPRVEQPANVEKLNPVPENDDQPRENLPEVENGNPKPLNSEPYPKIENPQSDIESKPLPDIDQPAGNGKQTILKPQEKAVVYDGSFQPLEDDLVPTTPSNDITSTTLSPKEPENKLPKKPRRKLIRRQPTTTTPAPTPANPDKNPDDEIITISPIELITENVSDVPPTTPSPVKPPGPEDRKKDKKQSSTTPAPSKDDKGKTTTVSPITTTVAADDDDETETSKPTTESPGEDAKIVVSIDSQDDDEEAPQVFKTNCKTIQAYSDDEDGDIKIDLPKGKGKGDSAMWVKTTNQDFIDILTGNNDNDMDMIYVFNIDYRPIIEREKHTQIFPNGTVVVTTKETTYSGKNDSKPKVVTSTQTMQMEDYDSDED
ncbi:proteoglycan 4-like isoform X4 [Spodoptera litura]|uniref:Proteoglycan 4-like isoform X4 n=1 Tax=Spodoptera litura TaxID=69820 RepID=A0A9J7IJU0_SPOLT|nr:proteoglycan 4-like isoform X4 [Spodoptera litura]